jgi:hypothetical protein
MKDKDIVLNESSVAVLETDVLAMYRDDVNLGSENLTGGLMPMLKIVQKDAEDFDVLSGKASVGDFYHTSAKKVYKNPEVSIVYFQSANLPKYKATDGSKQYTILAVGYILEDNLPFMMYIKGKSLSPFFEWQKQVATFKRSLQIPMYSFVNTLSTQRQQNDYGKFYVLNVDIAKDEATGVKLINDIEMAKVLREGVETARQAVATAVEVATGIQRDDVDESEVVPSAQPKTSGTAEEDINF